MTLYGICLGGIVRKGNSWSELERIKLDKEIEEKEEKNEALH